MKTKQKVNKFASHLIAAALTALVISMLMVPVQVKAGSLPTLKEFIEQVGNGDAEALRGAYVPGVFALPIVEQPNGNANYISPMSSNLTQFNMANKAGNVGLLAHNYLAGNLFFNIRQANLIILVYGNARTETFVVDRIYKYEALSNGTYKDIEAQKILNIGELFKVTYGGARHVTLQTCIAQEDNLSWGRLFVIARSLGSETAENALPGIVAAPPPPPPVMLLGWPLFNYQRQSRNDLNNAAR